MPAWEHQKNEVDAYTDEPARALFWEPRTGKTRTIIMQLEKKQFSRVLICAPIMALRMAWLQELKSLENYLILDLTQGALKNRNDALRNLRLSQKHTPNTKIVVCVNYEALKGLEHELLKWLPEAIVADEAHLIKSVSAKRSLIMAALGKRAVWRRILTGTPVPKNYIDIYAQYKFLDPSVFGTNKQNFVAEYCFTHPLYRDKVIGYRELPKLERLLDSRATRVKRADCFDLPDIQEIERVVTLPPAARKIYDAVKKQEFSEVAPGLTIDGSNKLARITKLQKLAAGFVKEESDPAPTWIHREKIAAVVDEIGEAIENNECVIVSYFYEHEGAELESTLQQFYAGVFVARLSGNTPQKLRESITAPFDVARRGEDTKPRILIVQEQVGCLGISLARADHMVFASCSMDNAIHSQMRDRIWSPVKKITYTYIRSAKTNDFFVKKIHETKKTAQELLLDIGFESAL